MDDDYSDGHMLKITFWIVAVFIVVFLLILVSGLGVRARRLSKRLLFGSALSSGAVWRAEVRERHLCLAPHGFS